MDPKLLENTIPGLSDEAGARLSALFERVECKKRDVLLKEGAAQEYAFIIESGVLARQKTCPGKKEDGGVIQVDQVHAGLGAGFHHLLKEDPAFTSIVVTSETALVWRISSKSFKSHCESDHAFLLEWCHSLNGKVRQQSKVMRALTTVASDAAHGVNADRTRVAFFDATEWTVSAFSGEQFTDSLHMSFFPQPLNLSNTALAAGCEVVCCFVNCDLSSCVLRVLSQLGVKLVAMRCAGFDRVCIPSCKVYGLTVARVPAYSPYAVAEHALALLMAINRHTHKAHNRTREGNFALKGLVGMDLHGKTVGIIGTGKIGRCFANIMLGMGCKLLCNDLYPSAELAQTPGVTYVELEELLKNSDVISLHAPLLPSTQHLLNEHTLAMVKPSCLIVNTSRGGLVDSAALLKALEEDRLGGVGLDVYEREAGVFFNDRSDTSIMDPVLVQLLAHPRAIVTGHQAFLTKDALDNIASTTLQNVLAWKEGKTGSEHPNSVW